MTRFHPESPDVSQDDLSRLRFIGDFRKQLHSLTRGNRATYDADLAADMPAEGPTRERRAAVKDAMEQKPFYRGWSSLLLNSQDLMWRVVGQSVDAEQDRMALRLKSLSNAAQGSVTLNPDLAGPEYLVHADVHRMPGGYMGEANADDLRAGALYDLGGAMYQLGIGNSSGGLLNDSRGRTVVAHLKTRFPDLQPLRILDMGCGVGHNTVPLANGFPDAEVYGIDVGAALVRYAHLRAEGLGRAVHFVQDNAERTRFQDESFDLVVSQIVLHETSSEASARIMAESVRLLRPGGVAIHLEVPLRADAGDVFDQMMSLWEEHYNAEPNISGVMDDDLVGMAVGAGLVDVQMGFQSIPAAGSKDSTFTGARDKSQFAQWLIISGRKPE